MVSVGKGLSHQLLVTPAFFFLGLPQPAERKSDLGPLRSPLNVLRRIFLKLLICPSLHPVQPSDESHTGTARQQESPLGPSGRSKTGKG